MHAMPPPAQELTPCTTMPWLMVSGNSTACTISQGTPEASSCETQKAGDKGEPQEPTDRLLEKMGDAWICGWEGVGGKGGQRGTDAGQGRPRLSSPGGSTGQQREALHAAASRPVCWLRGSSHCMWARGPAPRQAATKQLGGPCTRHSPWGRWR